MIAIGIDFGTTNSVAAINKDGLLTIVPTPQGKRIIPSVVSFSEKNEIYVGDNAKSQLVLGSKGVVYSVKKYLGTDKKFIINNHTYTPVQITAYILTYIKKQVENYIDKKVSHVVITAPAYFNLNQRRALQEACELAHLKLEDMINEPTSAAIAYGQNQKQDQNIVVYDLGGGTFDVSVINYSNNKFNVLAVAGDNNLGGDDFDFLILNSMIKKINRVYKINLLKNPILLYRLKEEIEKIKIQLSENDEAVLTLPFLNEVNSRGVLLKLSRDVFESLITPYIKKTISLMDKAVKEAKLTIHEIDRVLLAGGSTRIPFVKKMIHEYFKKNIYLGMNPNECVALGAAIHSYQMKAEQKAIILNDVIPLSLGIEIEGGAYIPIIKRNTRIPTTGFKIITPLSKTQKKIEIKIYQGERLKASENVFLGNLVLKNIKVQKKKLFPKIKIIFEVNEQGLINVTAKDLSTDKFQKIKLTPVYSTLDTESEKIIKQAQESQKEDEEFYYYNQIKVQSLELIKKLRIDLKDKNVALQDKREIKKDIKDIKMYLKKDDIEQLKSFVKQRISV